MKAPNLKCPYTAPEFTLQWCTKANNELAEIAEAAIQNYARKVCRSAPVKEIVAGGGSVVLIRNDNESCRLEDAIEGDYKNGWNEFSKSAMKSIQNLQGYVNEYHCVFQGSLSPWRIMATGPIITDC